jgi:hypothetical protein
MGVGRSCLALLPIAPSLCERHLVLLHSHSQPHQTEDMDRRRCLEIQ